MLQNDKDSDSVDLFASSYGFDLRDSKVEFKKYQYLDIMSLPIIRDTKEKRTWTSLSRWALFSDSWEEDVEGLVRREWRNWGEWLENDDQDE